MAQMPDPVALEVVGELKKRLQRRFGDRLIAVYLFGSRARGDHRPDGDADVAVFLRGPLGDSFSVDRDIVEDGYDLLLERGLYIQAWAFEGPMLEDPSGRLQGLLESVIRDSIQL